MSEAQKEAVERSAQPNDEIEIDLGKVLEAVKKFWALLLATTLVCGVLGFVISNYAMTKQYSASVDMIVNTSSDADLVSNDQVNSAKNLVSTYSFIITGSNVLTQVVKNLGLDMTYEELARRNPAKAATAVYFPTSGDTGVYLKSRSETIRQEPASTAFSISAGAILMISRMIFLESSRSSVVAETVNTCVSVTASTEMCLASSS